MASLKTRVLSIDDYDSIVELWKTAGLPFKPKGRESKDAIKRHMENEPDLFIGIFDGDKLVGVAIGSHDYRKGWINRLAVHPAYRRRGIGLQLISAIEEALKKKGIAIYAALIEKPNQASLKLFEKAGYIFDDSILYVSKRESADT